MTGVAVPSLLVVLALLLGIAACTDIRSRTIPNALNAAVALLGPVWWWANGLAPWPDVAIQLALFAAVLAVFTGLFAIGAMGGGDVKLLAALALWLPFDPLMDMLVLMAIGGGVLTLGMLVLHRLRRAEGRPEIPYGVAIAFATLWVCSQRYLYQFG